MTSKNESLSYGGLSHWPYFEQDEIEAASRVLASGKVNYWTGDEGVKFEKEYAEYTRRRHAVAVANGTLALELALRVLGVGPGDEVITSPRTFIASASCAVAVGARPVFADVDRETQNITAESIRAALTPATKAIVTVHLAGWPCEMDGIMDLASEHGLKVIEDCAQAHGATHKGRPVGSMGDVGAFSFCQDKIITTAGEGGMITLDSDKLYEEAWAYKDHGKSYDAVYRRKDASGFRWLHESFGTNWRMTEIQSAIGRLQLNKLSSWVLLRQRNAAMLSACFAELPGLRVTIPPAYIGHAYYKYYAFVRLDLLRAGWNRGRILAEIVARGVPCFSGSCSEIYLEKAFPIEWRPADPLPIARELGETSLMFLVHPTLKAEYVARICEVVKQVMHEATKESSGVRVASILVPSSPLGSRSPTKHLADKAVHSPAVGNQTRKEEQKPAVATARRPAKNRQIKLISPEQGCNETIDLS
jgi:dTDP-4-amino-4,6-dideoxygalactose transaminase